jgi:hypothetical protein
LLKTIEQYEKKNILTTSEADELRTIIQMVVGELEDCVGTITPWRFCS